MKVLITGWAGFIGSNLTRMILSDTDWDIYGMDSHTYAARPLWVYTVVQSNQKLKDRFFALPNDIRTFPLEGLVFDVVIHLAAESHVCRSIEGPEKFIDTNILGTFNLLEGLRRSKSKAIFHHVSTDEVYGVAQEGSKFKESTPYDPRSPYSASKAASDHLVSAYHHTYGLNTRITNCSNNFGANQHSEKLIPKTIKRILKGEPVTLYGPGNQVRDWIWVDDHCRGILAAIANGSPGGTYLLGGECERTNLEVVQDCWIACQEVAEEQKIKLPTDLVIEHTNDRPTDDQRYAIDCSHAKKMLNWKPLHELYFERLKETVRWYLKHEPT